MSAVLDIRPTTKQHLVFKNSPHIKNSPHTHHPPSTIDYFQNTLSCQEHHNRNNGESVSTTVPDVLLGKIR